MADEADLLVVALPGGVAMEFVRVDSGTFMMGSPLTEPGRDEDEGPRRQVRISHPYYLGKTEVTQDQWQAVTGARPWSGQDFVREGPGQPAVHIAWHDVQRFVQALNELAAVDLYRLPTEAEWEYACRAGTATRWSFGDDEALLDEYAWHTGNSWEVGERYAHAVGTRLPNRWGLYDMHGNVNEWVQDRYRADYYRDAPDSDPPGSDSGDHRVLRGGYFHQRGGRRLRCANRLYLPPDTRTASLGVRLLRRIP